MQTTFWRAQIKTYNPFIKYRKAKTIVKVVSQFLKWSIDWLIDLSIDRYRGLFLKISWMYILLAFILFPIFNVLVNCKHVSFFVKSLSKPFKYIYLGQKKSVKLQIYVIQEFCMYNSHQYHLHFCIFVC